MATLSGQTHGAFFIASSFLYDLQSIFLYFHQGHRHYFQQAKHRGHKIKGCAAGNLWVNENKKTYWWCKHPHDRQVDTMMLTR